MLLPFFSSAQILIDGSPLVYSRSARGEALGSSEVAEIHDITSIYSNPAAVVFMDAMHVAAGAYLVWDDSQISDYLVAPIRLGKTSLLSLGITHTAYGVDWQSPQAVFRSIEIGYAIKIADALSIGALASTQNSKTTSQEKWNAYGSIAVFYLPTSGMRYGITLEGLGNAVDYSRYQLTIVPRPTKILRMGTSYSYPTHSPNKLVTLTVSGEKHYGMKGLHYLFGIEVSPLSFVQLRMGYLDKPEASTEFRSGARYGIGFSTRLITFDYCVSPGYSAKQHHQLTLYVRYN